tara:strand:- start:151 stop:918 length:768 start_codon:yes stop_codon:yes gene_type:complete
MFINNFDPVALTIFSLEIRWYSLAYVFGIMSGWLILKNILAKEHQEFKKLEDLLTYIIIGIILGGRLGYVLFYNLEYYFYNFFEIVMIWKGGMSFHGGLIGIVISTFIFCNKNKYNPYIFLDLIAFVSPIGIFFGRIANFLNSELYGKVSNIPWGVIFVKVDNLPRHPSQIYEASLEGMILFLILLILVKNNFLKKRGLISSLFLIFYSSFRFFVEFFREPDNQLGYLIFNLSMGQILCFVFFIIGIVLLKKNET